MRWFLHWILSAVALLAVAHLVPGFRVSGFVVALIAAVVIGVVNGTLGLVLKVLTFPLTLVTFGLFLLVINALMLQLVAWFLPGFYIASFWSGFWGALLLAVLNMVIRGLLKDKKEAES
jgi:putative membrane protein